MASTKTYKLDIFEVLKRASIKDVAYFEQLSEEQQKALAPLVVMRWLSGTPEARQVVFINELVNPFIFSLHQHKDLLVKLMTVCTSGRSRRYIWNKTKGKTVKAPIAISVICEMHGYSSAQAIEVFPLLSNEDLIDYAEQLGRQKDEIAKLKKELKTREARA